MVFQDYKIEDDKITFTKEELQKARDHYLNVADKYVADKYKLNNDSGVIDIRHAYYLGKVAVLIDMLKMFEPIDFI